MKRKKERCKEKSLKITRVVITTDTLTSRGGLSLFIRYLNSIGIMPHIERLFGSMRRNRKGRPVVEIFKQVLCNFVDGTRRHLVHYDLLKKDAGYTETIESSQGTLLYSHAVKRFFKMFSWSHIWLFR